jgi:hypothetical protein
MRRIHFKRVVVLMATLLCASVAFSEIIEVPLVYEAYPDQTNEPGFQPQGYAYLPANENPPEGEWKLPELNSDKPVYGVVNIAEQERLLILDQTDKNAFYNRLYFDINGNRDFTDDAPIDALNVSSSSGQYYYAHFPGIDIDTVIDGVTMQYRFGVVVNYWSDKPVSWGSRILNFFTGGGSAPDSFNIRQLNLNIRSRCLYTAEFEIGDIKHHLLLSDYNVNGRFDERGSVNKEQKSYDGTFWPQGDMQYVIEAEAKPDYRDGMILTDYLSLNDTLYSFGINQPGNKLTLTPVTENLATLELPAAVQRIAMLADEASVAAIKPGSQLKAPAGTYRLLDYLLYKDEPEGARWQLWARGTWDSPEIAAKAGESVLFPFGEPYRPQVGIPAWMRQNMENIDREWEEIQIEFKVTGAANETVNDLACRENSGQSKIARSERSSSRPKEATYRIMKPDGEVHTQGTFEYG